VTPGTVVDSSVLLDVFTEDPGWGEWSTSALSDAASSGPLIINAVILAEVAPRFSRIEDLEDALPSFVRTEEIPRAAGREAPAGHRADRPRNAVRPAGNGGPHRARPA
jgi:hypothetical protein